MNTDEKEAPGEARHRGGWCGGRDISIRTTTKSMATHSQIIKQDRHPVWLADALILSAVAYSDNPRQELETLNRKIYPIIAESKTTYLVFVMYFRAGSHGSHREPNCWISA